MDNFQYKSFEEDLKTSTENDSIYEYVTTVNPFKIQTTPQTHERYDISSTGLYVLYGMGGILIFFIVYTILYGLCMPAMSDEALRRIEANNIRSLRERARAQERTEQANLEVVSSPDTISGEVTSSSQVASRRTAMDIRRIIGQHSRRITEASTPLSSRPEGEERFSVRRIQEIIRSNTEPKRGMGRSNDSNPIHQNRTSAMQASSLLSSELHESFNNDEIGQQLNTDRLPKHDCQNFTDTESNLDIISDELSDSINMPSTSHQARSQSSPTSPDIVRRRLPSFESTPRRPSSWR